MTAVSIPAGVGYAAFAPELLYFGGVLTGPLGAADQYIDRLGDRYQMMVQFPEMAMEPKGRQLIAALKAGWKEGLRIPVPQDGLVIGTPGTVRVAGGGQSGTSLIVDGFTAGYKAVAGQFFELVHDGRSYLHSLAADVTADGSGNATLTLIEPLRVIPADNALCDFATPMIEGYPQGPSLRWDVPLTPTLAPLAITIKEAR